jgi:hypothetical protein
MITNPGIEELIYNSPWNLDGNEDLSHWPTQVWYRCDLGLFCITVDGGSRWVFTHRSSDEDYPEWHGQEYTKKLLDYLIAHHHAAALIRPDPATDYTQEDAEQAMEYANG